jgi:hypothetical protein
VDPSTIVITFDVGEQIAPGGIAIEIFALIDELGFQGAKKLSIGALSQKFAIAELDLDIAAAPGRDPAPVQSQSVKRRPPRSPATLPSTVATEKAGWPSYHAPGDNRHRRSRLQLLRHNPPLHRLRPATAPIARYPTRESVQ